MALTDSLISYWKMDEASGVRNDAHGGNHLTDNNTVGSATGLLGNCGVFVAASAEYLSRPHIASLAVTDQDFTLTCWYKVAGSQATTSRLMSKRSSNTNCDYDIYLQTDNRPSLEIRNASGTAAIAQWSSLVSLNTWHFVVGWHDAAANTVSVRVDNGSTVTTSTGGIIPGGTGEFRIGDLQQVSRPFNGQLDESGFWKRVLTSAEQTELYNGGAGLAYPFGSVASSLLLRRMMGAA